MTTPTDTERLVQALRPAFITAQSCGPDSKYELVFKFRSLDALQTAHRAAINFLAESDCAHESRAQPASVADDLDMVARRVASTLEMPGFCKQSTKNPNAGFVDWRDWCALLGEVMALRRALAAAPQPAKEDDHA